LQYTPKSPIFVKKQAMTAQKLTNLQVELIKVFSFDLSEAQVLEIRSLLANYFADKATEEADRLWEERGWTDETMENWADEHFRTPYEN